MSKFDCVSHSKKGIMNWVVFAALVLLPVSVAQAEEAILNFHSDITVNRDGSLDVVEKITVNAEGRSIKRGIYRDLPTSYAHPKYGKLGFKSKTPIKIFSVESNGKSEQFHTQELSNGVRVFFGSLHTYLDRGEHTYILHYSIERQIALNAGGAQLYWNVTGNGWGFRINRASAEVSFPGNATVYQQQVYTGSQGSTASEAKFSSSENLDLIVTSDRPLQAGQGMTISVQFDAAEMTMPQESDMAALYRDNPIWFWGAGMLVLMAIILLVFWYKIGRDPERGIVIAQYRPVKDLSAAAHRAVYLNRVDDTSFSVGVLSAAIKGWLTISKLKGGAFRLKSTEPESGERKPLSPTEKMLVNDLFAGRKSLTLNGDYDESLKKLKLRYDKFLQKEFSDKSHQPHGVPLFIAGLIGLIGLGMMATVNFSNDSSQAGLMLVIGVFVSIALGALLRKVQGSFSYSLAISSLVIAALNVYYANSLMAIGFVVYGVLLALFTYLMPAPKQSAVGLLDQIEGFSLYLSKAEHDSLKRLDLPEKTPQLYEELLPFAIALNLETQWSDQFTEVLAAANWDSDKNAHRSSWYVGDSGSSIGSFAPAVAAGLATSVVAASTPPSSSSSGSSGGFSGGGGGGGGGGGW